MTTFELICRVRALVASPEGLTEAAFEAILSECADKVEALLAVVARLDAEQDILAAEGKILTAAARQLGEQSERCRDRLASLLDAMEAAGEEPVVRAGGRTVSLRRTVAVEIADPTAIPADYLRVRSEPDKGAIKAALEAGQAVPGAELRHNVSVSIRPAK